MSDMSNEKQDAVQQASTNTAENAFKARNFDELEAGYYEVQRQLDAANKEREHAYECMRESQFYADISSKKCAELESQLAAAMRVVNAASLALLDNKICWCGTGFVCATCRVRNALAAFDAGKGEGR